jgi:hypothetical protein
MTFIAFRVLILCSDHISTLLMVKIELLKILHTHLKDQRKLLNDSASSLIKTLELSSYLHRTSVWLKYTTSNSKILTYNVSYIRISDRIS